jgi:threonyl-tRNA synthetase
VQVRTVLRYVENRRVMTSREAERKVEEIVSDLFPYKGTENLWHAKNQVRIVAIPTRDHTTATFNDGTILQGSRKSPNQRFESISATNLFIPY